MADLSLKNIYKKYAGGVIAANDICLDIDDKEFIILVGPSGCGKSTTLRMIAGLEDISSGQLYIDGKLMNDVAPKDRDIAMVFQNYALYPHMTVFDNMAFGLKLRKTPKDEIKRRVESTAQMLEIGHLLDRKPKALSGGQRQRVALGRAIVREPKVFLMDEPLSNLDAKLRVQMRAVISKLHQTLETTFVYVTHDQTEALTMGTRIVVMKDGYIQQVDSPQELYDNPVNLFVAGFIGSPEMNFITAKLEKEGERVSLSFGKGHKIFIVESKAKQLLENCPEYIGKEVIMGIRPESVHDEEVYLATMSDSKATVSVDLTESLGADTLLHLDVDGTYVVARVNPRTKAKSGEKIDIVFDTNRLHLFDKETELAILN
ncbi:MAG: sn-glycerol-3-phosphate ABC transporter ATP-binding protein UgpC [Bacillota bacterium]|nr:sn-glycerol-3-phosphate ABC transporter ATP-binding protein UgpC [Bacillota bacterium]